MHKLIYLQIWSTIMKIMDRKFRYHDINKRSIARDLTRYTQIKKFNILVI